MIHNLNTSISLIYIHAVRNITSVGVSMRRSEVLAMLVVGVNVLLLGIHIMKSTRRVQNLTTNSGKNTTTTTTTTKNWPSCKRMFAVFNKGRPRTQWNDDYPYEVLSRQLPSLLVQQEGETNITKAHVYMGTRLESMGGGVPYLPCKVSILQRVQF